MNKIPLIILSIVISICTTIVLFALVYLPIATILAKLIVLFFMLVAFIAFIVYTMLEDY